MGIDYNVLGMRIRKIRKKRNITQERLAELTNLSVVYISKIENAKRAATLDTIVNIVNVLGCTVDDLLDGYLHHKDTSAPDNIADVLADCSAQERRYLYRIVTSLKEIVRNSV